MMVFEEMRTEVESILKDAVTALCSESFAYQETLQIHGAITVILDSSEEFTLHMNSKVYAEASNDTQPTSKISGLLRVVKTEADLWQAKEVEQDIEKEDIESNDSNDVCMKSENEDTFSTPKSRGKRGRGRPRKNNTPLKSPTKMKGSDSKKITTPTKDELSQDDNNESDQDLLYAEGFGHSSDSDNPTMQEYSSLIPSETEHTPKRQKISNSTDTDCTPKQTKTPKRRKRRPAIKMEPHPKPIKGDGLFKCPLCSFEDAIRRNIEKHIRSHSRYVQVCDICDECFDAKADLMKHIDEKHSGVPFICGICSKIFPDRPGLWSHKRKIHKFQMTPRVSTTKCKECDYTSENIPELMRHIESHIVSKFHCDICGKGCSNKDKLQGHIENYHTGESYVCDFCFKECKSKQGLEHHKSLIHFDEIPEADLLSCLNCDFKTSLEKFYKLHLVDQEGNQWSCFICNENVSCKKHLKQHLQECHPDKSKNILCPICMKVFYTKNSFYMHKREEHGIAPESINTEKFQCNVCGKEFPIIEYLKRHVRSHACPEPYECPKCRKCFKYHRSCVIHLDECQSKKGYPCLICNKRLKTEYAVVTHMRNMHSGIDAFPCKNCHKGFRNKYNLNKHEATCGENEDNKEETYKIQMVEKDDDIKVEMGKKEERFELAIDNTAEETFEVEIEFPASYQEVFTEHIDINQGVALVEQSVINPNYNQQIQQSVVHH